MPNVNSVLVESAPRTSLSHVPLVRTKRLEARSNASGELVLIRGLPGSGKSTMAKDLVTQGYLHFEADMFFEVDGHYQYDASRIREAHSWCQQMTRQALAKGLKVVVSNTFTQLREMEPYRSMTQNVLVVEANGKWKNVHGVPAEMLEKMAQRWEPLRNSADSTTAGSTVE